MTTNGRVFWIAAGIAAGAALFSWTPVNPFLRESAFTADDVAARDMQTILASLQENMTLWPALSRQQKFEALEYILRAYRSGQHVQIEKTPNFYLDRLDEVSQQEAMKQLSIERVVMMLAIMEYDFGNGMDPDALARRVLGPVVYEANKKRREEAPVQK